MKRFHALSESNEVWAIIPERLVTMQSVARQIAAGAEIEIQAAKRLPKVSGSLAFMPLYGTIQQRPSMWMELFGGTSTDAFGRAFEAAVRNPEIKGIVIDVDSPGGTVYGVEELSAKMRDLRGNKPVVSVANSLAASAAYWTATAADQLVVAPSGDVGSIGVFATHVDLSGAMEQDGVKVQFVSAGKYKTEGNPYEALSDEARASMQARVDDFYSMFISAVAKNRGKPESAVRNDFGQGRVVRSQEALSVGMVDRIATLEKVVQGMGGYRSSGGSRAEKDAELTDVLVSAWNAGLKVEEEQPTESGGDPDVLRRKLELKQKAV